MTDYKQYPLGRDAERKDLEHHDVTPAPKQTPAPAKPPGVDYSVTPNADLARSLTAPEAIQLIKTTDEKVVEEHYKPEAPQKVWSFDKKDRKFIMEVAGVFKADSLEGDQPPQFPQEPGTKFLKYVAPSKA